MAKKGENSKQKLVQDILRLYPNNAFVQDKSIYVNFNEDGENVQLKIAVTMPKIPIEFVGQSVVTSEKEDFDWSEEKESAAVEETISQEEIDLLVKMLEKIDL